MKGLIETPLPGKLFVVRHASTAFNTDGDKIRGWIDLPLDDEGLEETKRLAQRMKKEKIDGIVSSDLKRARQTAESIAEATGAPILAISPDYRPWHLGVFQGQESNKVVGKMKEYIENPKKKVPDGECFDDFKERFLDAIMTLSVFSPKNIALVTHHRNERLLNAWYLEGCPKDYKIDETAMQTKGIPPSEFRITHYPI